MYFLYSKCVQPPKPSHLPTLMSLEQHLQPSVVVVVVWFLLCGSYCVVVVVWLLMCIKGYTIPTQKNH